MSKKQYIQNDIDNFLDCFLSTSESRRTSKPSRKEDFSSQWYDYEEEYSYNFCGLE